MQGGKLRHQIQLLKPRRSRDVAGEEYIAWDEHLVLWAQVRQVSGRDMMRAMQPVTETRWAFLIRWAPGLQLDETMRILYAGRTFEIVAPPRDINEERRMIEIEAREHRP